MKPPKYIDRAKVIKWAWSGLQPFGIMRSEDGTEKEEIYGLAICQYEGSKTVYRFSCNESWETIQDGVYPDVEQAVRLLPDQYKCVAANWHLWESGE
ncbi:hypothetical protein [Chitinophaga nivalis]|uniref:Uncharacterized protein n=1 Tax=Chitinophaga nivalis TaxID=2991709 RepID=A0ABT3IUF4_9BACT|nr:hypothetical protein [Chitinophaga nivalis]MCW3462981.1 hypothetical protein [Chitinophaga nivalis]MCW3487329.1 hypothetical protein [Chitinophaga nivalis]